jgi:hypothetical protein
MPVRVTAAGRHVVVFGAPALDKFLGNPLRTTLQDFRDCSVILFTLLSFLVKCKAPLRNEKH